MLQVLHFPANNADFADVDPALLDDEGSYGRFALSGGTWLHRIVRMPNASAALQAFLAMTPCRLSAFQVFFSKMQKNALMHFWFTI